MTADRTPFYVGKGGNDNGKRSRKISTRSAEFMAVYDQGGCTVEIVDEFILESEAHAHEMELIEKYGRREFGGMLVNKTDGGEGTSGHIHSAETKARLSAAHRGKIVSPETRAKLSAFNRGRPRDPAAVAKTAAANRGQKRSPATRAKMSAAITKALKAPEVLAKKSAAGRKIWEDPEFRSRMSGAIRRHYENPAARAVTSSATRKQWENQETRARMSEAIRMSPPRYDNTSGFKGVSFRKGSGKWHARVLIEGKSRHLGFFPTPEEAARAYDAAAIAAWGIGNCYLNFPEEADRVLAG